MKEKEKKARKMPPNYEIRTVSSRLHLDKRIYTIIKEMSHNSKNMENITLYNIRQHFFNAKKYPKYEEVYEQLKQGPDYKSLPAQVAQQAMQQIDSDMKSFLHF